MLDRLRKSYESNIISNVAYSRAAWETHQHLFEYPSFMEETNVQSIEITPAGVQMRLKDPDLKFWLSKFDQRHIALSCLNFRDYERSEMEMVLSLAKGCRTIFDVGANSGLYAMTLATKIPHSHVVAFEPIGSTSRDLSRNLELNNIENVAVYNCGLLDRNGWTEFYLDPDVPGATSAAPLGPDFTNDAMVCSCEIHTMDWYVQQSGVVPEFIKCDVEGAELLVFKGAEETLRKAHPIIFTEMLRKWARRFNYYPNELIGYLSEFGYLCFSIADGKLVPFDTMTDETVETNFFFLHGGKA